MSSKLKPHDDHTSQSLFHHGLIKLIITTVLQHEGRTWDFFLFWSDVHPQKEEQQPKRQTDKGMVMIKNLGHSVKSTSKDEVKAKKVTEQVAKQVRITISSKWFQSTLKPSTHCLQVKMCSLV